MPRKCPLEETAKCDFSILVWKLAMELQSKVKNPHANQDRLETAPVVLQVFRER